MARDRTLAKREPRELEPFEPLSSFRDMERMFRDFFTSPLNLMRPPRSWPRELILEYTPDVNLKETDHELILSATIPGLTRDDMDINVTEDRITITGERKSEEEHPGERYHVRQQSYGSFTVSYLLPAEVKPGEVKATYKNGILEVTMPKAEVVEPHRVEVEIED